MGVEGKEKRMQSKGIRKSEGTFLRKVSKLGNARESEVPLDPVGRCMSGASITMAVTRPNVGERETQPSKNPATKRKGLGSGMQRCQCYHANSNGTGREMYQHWGLVIIWVGRRVTITVQGTT